MPSLSAPINEKVLMRRLRPYGYALHLSGCFLIIALGKAFAGGIADGKLIWFVNGTLLAYLLLAPRRRWPAYIGAALLGHIAGSFTINTTWQVHFANIPIDLAEPMLSAFLLRRRSAQLPRFTEKSYLLRFLAFAVLAGPLAGSILGASLQAFWYHADFCLVFFRWATADALGVCVVTPALVAIFRAHLESAGIKEWGEFLVFVIIAYFVFAQTVIPLAFLLYPLLILVLLRLNMGWASVATLCITIVGGWLTVHRHGPFALSRSISSIEPAVVLQLFVLSAIIMLYSVSVVIESQRLTERRLRKIAALHRLVTENSRDVIIISDLEGNLSYVSAIGDKWGGWNKEELLNISCLELIHPDDHPAIESIAHELLDGKDGALIECRALNRDGTYTWIEVNLRMLRNPTTNTPTGILSNVRAITKRKLAEQRLQDAYHTLETMASTDVLTGLANRRSFDQHIAHEWRRCLRERKYLSLLILDADMFKSYNDSYGHLRGDSCLRQIAEAAQNVVSRPGDLVARFGGEEFAVILPNTKHGGAIQIANDISEAVRQRQIAHAANPAGKVTISIGCATLIPQLGCNAAFLIDCADQALYQAKHSGRNCIRTYKPKTGDAQNLDANENTFTARTA